MALKDVQTSIRELANSEIAEHSQRFFKTGVGEYGEGDHFLGIKVPVIRKEVKKFKKEEIKVIIKLLSSKYHEERLFSLIWLVEKYKKGNEEIQESIYEAYIQNLNFVNNWDLVDSSAHLIVGPHLETKDKSILYKFAVSKNLWERRISIMSTFHYIKKGEFVDALKISEILLGDSEDLIHKSVGWMLREIGNRDKDSELLFLKKFYKDMPRTMLRYAIEKFEKPERDKYLKGLI